MILESVRKRAPTVIAVLAVAGMSGYIMQSKNRGAEQVAQIALAEPATPLVVAESGPAPAPEAEIPGLQLFAGVSRLDLPPLASTMPSPAVMGGGLALLANVVTLPVMPPVFALPAAPGPDMVTRAQILTTPIAPPVPEAEAPLRLASAEGDLSLNEASPTPLLPPVSEPLADGCEVGFTALGEAGAMVALTLESPCHAGEQVEFSHGGLMLTAQLDAAGLVEMAIPAMEEQAFFTARFDDGSTATAETLMFTMRDYKRVALVWYGETGFALEAFENGAMLDEAGHVSGDRPGTPEQAVHGEGGFLTLLGSGSGGFSSVVYSYPSVLLDTGPAPKIDISAEVIPGNCGKVIAATYVQANPEGLGKISPLHMAVPDCSAVGEYLVLIIPPEDRKIALD